MNQNENMSHRLSLANLRLETSGNFVDDKKKWQRISAHRLDIPNFQTKNIFSHVKLLSGEILSKVSARSFTLIMLCIYI